MAVVITQRLLRACVHGVVWCGGRRSPTWKSAREAVFSACGDHPMAGCAGCSRSDCDDPLASYASICQEMPSMAVCGAFWAWCDAAPGLDKWCTYDRARYLPSMLMYFHQRVEEMVLWKEWRPTNNGGWVGEAVPHTARGLGACRQACMVGATASASEGVGNVGSGGVTAEGGEPVQHGLPAPLPPCPPPCTLPWPGLAAPPVPHCLVLLMHLPAVACWSAVQYTATIVVVLLFGIVSTGLKTVKSALTLAWTQQRTAQYNAAAAARAASIWLPSNAQLKENAAKAAIIGEGRASSMPSVGQGQGGHFTWRVVWVDG